MRKAERDYINQVSSLPCCTCGDTPVEIHHIREGQGMAQRAQHFLVLPLCPDCHRGPNGIHGNKSMMRMLKKDELDLLAETMEKLYG